MPANKPTFNIFDPLTKCDIRVGYISTTRGYIPNLTRHEANEHARLDPGTTFIFHTRDDVKYLSINEVNNLTVDDLSVSDGGVGCLGPKLNRNEGGSGAGEGGSVGKDPYIVYSGGGGVGAAGNPVVGTDGSLLAVDMIAGGYGYEIPPHARAVDDRQIAGSPVLEVILCEDIVETEEVYDKEDDFEEYDLTSCRPITTDPTLRWGMDGKVDGIWDPKVYTQLTKDPIKREIEKYQDYIEGGLNPWWTTRKEAPLSVTSETETKRTVFPVRHWYWGGSQSGGVTTGGVTTGGEPLEFVEVPFLVYTEGGHDRGLLFQFISADGSHKFKIKADDYKDGAQAVEVKHKIKPNMVYNVVSAGSHKKGRGTEQGLITAGSFGRRGKEQDDAGGEKSGITIFADLVSTRDDDDDLQVQSKLGVFKQGAKGRSSDNKHDTFELTYILEDSSAFTAVKTTPVKTTPVTTAVDDSFMNRYAISPVPPSNVPGSDFAGITYTFIWEEDFPYDGEYVFRGMRDNEAKFYIDNVFVPNAVDPNNPSSLTTIGRIGSGPTPTPIKKTMKAGVHELRIDLLNLPIKEKKVVQATGSNDVTFKITSHAQFANGIIIHGLGIDIKKTFDGPQINRSFTKTPERGRMYDVTFSSDQTKHGIRLRTRGENVLQMEEHDDNDWSDIVCTASQGRFVNLSGNKCKFILDKAAGSTGASPGSTSSEEIKVTNVFSTTSHIDKANRQLWRTNVYNRGGFINEYGICPFDTKKSLEDNPYAGSHQIKWGNVNFPVEGNYNIQVAVDDNVNLKFLRKGKIEVELRKEGFVNKLDSGWPDNDKPGNHSTGNSTYERFFPAGTYEIIADLEQIPGGAFSFGPGITVGGGKGGNVQAKFGQSGSNYYVDVTGSGSATLRFNMKAKDSWRIAGVAASEIRIDSDRGQVKLRRRKGVSKENVTATGIFTAGQRYKVNIIGAVAGAGKPRVYDKRLELLDAHGNDTNVELKLEAITNEIPDPVKGINPMALAIKVDVSYYEEEFVSPKPWNINPMGVALTIDAPMPPIPQEPIIDQEGRCPKNPIWSTRFPGAREQWWPVNGDPRWSTFMNRYALSPVPPLTGVDSDKGGVLFQNSWPLDVPYDGFYGLRGTRDNWGRVIVDGVEISKLDGFKQEAPTLTKFFLSKGSHTIDIEVKNEWMDTYKLIDQKVFDTADWAVPVVVKKESGMVDVTFHTTSHAQFANWIDVKGLFKESKTYDGPQINRRRTVSVEIGKIYDVEVGSSNQVGGAAVGIKYSGLNAANDTIKVTSGGKRIELKDSKGDDTNVSFTIDSGKAKFSSDGKSIEGSGKVKINLTYDDNPNYASEAVRTIKILDVTWTKEKKHHGGETKTVDLGKGGTASGYGGPGVFLRTKGKNVLQMEEWKDNDWTDIISSASRGRWIGPDGGPMHPPIKGTKCKFVVDGAVEVTGGLSSGETRGEFGVTYEGPKLATYRVEALGPSLTPMWKDDQDFRDNFMGREWVSLWKNVRFPETGRYKLECIADDKVTIRIDGSEVGHAKVFEHIRTWHFSASKGLHDIEMTYHNIPGGAHNNFWNNPVAFSAVITRKISVTTGHSEAWTANPVAISAILIPPPCPRKVEGKGVVCETRVKDPGNGWPTEGSSIETSRYPITTQLTELLPPDDNSSINYGPGDLVCVETPGGGEICYSPILTTFGKITGVPINPPIVGLTEWPDIRITSSTGVGAQLIPNISIIRDPIGVDPDKLIQVTDLVGLKQTGYYDGRAYYGAVFYKDGIRYAGYYETPGQLVQIYATLQESIDAEVTTPPSAIQRQGTDITSNDPRLGIPGTPDNLI